jgi:hypothetical protein
MRRARRSASMKSFSTSANFFPTMDWRATSTRSTGLCKSYWWRRNASRNRRRARLRSTAPPSLRPVTTPSRDEAPWASGIQFAIRHPCTVRFPWVRARANSPGRFRRRLRENSSGAGESAPMGIKPESDVYGRLCGGFSRCPGRSWLHCGCENRAGVFDEFSTADIDVSCFSFS